MTFTELERLAVVEAEVRHLTRQHEESRVEVRNEFREVRDEIKSVKNDVAEIKQLLTKAKGGWLAVSGGWRVAVFTGGAISIAASYVWDWLAPLIRALPR